MLKLYNSNFKIKHFFYFGLALFATIEIMQIVFRLGLFEWDIIHNTLGCVLGTLITQKVMIHKDKF